MHLTLGILIEVEYPGLKKTLLQYPSMPAILFKTTLLS